MTDAAAQRFPAHVANVGGLPLNRALPTRGKRLVGAWCFLDHAGPADVRAGAGLRVGPHPHIGLQTFTWMIDGELLHRDSLGSVQLIRPGQVNLMTAGRGISHSEESPLPHSPRLQAAQLWIALPDAVRHCPPAFEHYPDLPRGTRDGFATTLLVGEMSGQRSPVRVHSPLFAMDLVAQQAAGATLPLRDDFEYGVLVLEGEATVDGEPLPMDTLLYLAPGRAQLRLAASAGARILLLGGEPFGEDVLLFWNFVGRTPEEMAEAARQWNAGDARFGEVRGFDGPRLAAPEPPAGLKATR